MEKNKKENLIKPKLLLHSCCAPCSSGVVFELSKNYNISIYFYNPNIDSLAEFELRKSEQIRFLNEIRNELDIPIFCEEYNPKEYDEIVQGLESQIEGGRRCEKCFYIRLAKTAEFARKNKFDCFTTTLSVSPYKNADLLNTIGKEISKKTSIKYFESNFKKNNGYLKSIQNSKKYNLYRQNYCGCKYSKKTH